MSFSKRLAQLIEELKRRKVFRVASFYLVAAWGASLGAAELLPAFGVADWGVRAFIVALALGFPIAIVLAWIYELTSDGLKRETERPAHALPRGRSATTQMALGAESIRVAWDEGDRREIRTFANSFVIGRDESCELSVDNPMVSRRHTRVFVEFGRWFIEDLNSRNGTRVNGELITRAPIDEKATISLYPDCPPFSVEILQPTGEAEQP